MTESLYWIVMLGALSLFLALLYVDFLEHFFTRRFHIRHAALLPTAAMTAVYAFLLLFVHEITLYGTVLLFFSLAVAVGFYREREGNARLLLPPVYVAILLLSKHLVPLLLLNLSLIRPGDLQAASLTNLMIRVLGIVVFFVVVKLMERVSHLAAQQIPWSYWLLLMVVPSSTVMAFVSAGDVDFYSPTPGPLLPVKLLALIGLLFSNLIVFYLFENSVKASEYRHSLALLKQQVELQNKFYSEQKESIETTRRRLHDVKNAVIYLELLIREKRMQELEEFVRCYRQEIDRSGSIQFTGNSIFDAVLYQKYSAARSQGIDVRVFADIPPSISIEPNDICSVLGNALDNAIEACQRLPAGADAGFAAGGRTIEVKINCERGYLRISVKNPFVQPLQMENDGYLSAKSDPQNHGLGIRSMEAVAQKYNGNLHIHTKDGCFYLTVILAI
jgi:signal transduction histidine kinase